jgi:hypothetical protein
MIYISNKNKLEESEMVEKENYLLEQYNNNNILLLKVNTKQN